MDLKELQRHWNAFGKIDPLHSIYRPLTKDKKWDLEEFFRLGQEEVDLVMKYVESLGLPLKRGNALDFGCGVGRLTQALASYFDKVTGIDIAPSMIELANQYNRFPGKCTYDLNETDHLGIFPASRFDFIYSNITLQHMEPRYVKNYLKEFLRILTPQGLLIFQEPSEKKIRSEEKRPGRRLKRAFRPLVPSAILNAYYRFRGISIEPPPVSDGPQMETYAIPREELIPFLETSGGEVIEAIENNHTGPHWMSFQYCVRKHA